MDAKQKILDLLTQAQDLLEEARIDGISPEDSEDGDAWHEVRSSIENAVETVHEYLD